MREDFVIPVIQIDPVKESAEADVNGNTEVIKAEKQEESMNGNSDDMIEGVDSVENKSVEDLEDAEAAVDEVDHRLPPTSPLHPSADRTIDDNLCDGKLIHPADNKNLPGDQSRRDSASSSTNSSSTDVDDLQSNKYSQDYPSPEDVKNNEDKKSSEFESLKMLGNLSEFIAAVKENNEENQNK